MEWFFSKTKREIVSLIIIKTGISALETYAILWSPIANMVLVYHAPNKLQEIKCVTRETRIKKSQLQSIPTIAASHFLIHLFPSGECIFFISTVFARHHTMWPYFSLPHIQATPLNACIRRKKREAYAEPSPHFSSENFFRWYLRQKQRYIEHFHAPKSKTSVCSDKSCRAWSLPIWRFRVPSTF